MLILAIRHRHEKLVRFLVDHYDVRADQTDSIKPPEDAASANKEADCTPMLESIFTSSPTILNILCKKMQDLNSLYPVHLVCQRKIHDATMKLTVLLRNGADVNIKDETGLTPLIIACQNGACELAVILLQYGADVNLCSSDGNTALHHLIEHCDDLQKSAEKAIRNTSKALLQHGILQTPNGKGLTPLRLACLKGNMPMVQFLLDNLPDDDRETANCYELLASSILYKHGLMSSKNKHLLESYQFLHKAMLLRYSHDPPLRKCMNEKLCVTFLSHVEAQTLDNLAAIRTSSECLAEEMIVVRHRILDEDLYHDHLLPIVRTYIDHKVEELRQSYYVTARHYDNLPNCIPKSFVHGDNTLHIACREISEMYQNGLLKQRSNQGLTELLKMLLACGEDVNAQNGKGQTPLQVLLWFDRHAMPWVDIQQPRFLEDVDLPEAVRVLLLAGANPDLQSNAYNGKTSLHLAMRGFAYRFRDFTGNDRNMRGWYLIITILLKSGANPMIVDLDGCSSLHHLMAGIFREYIILSILAAQLYSEDQHKYQWQLLHELVWILQSYGGSAHTTNRDGESAIDICEDEDLKEKMRQDIQVTDVHFTLSGLAAAAIRKHQIKYQDKLPAKLIKIVELRD